MLKPKGAIAPIDDATTPTITQGRIPPFESTLGCSLVVADWSAIVNSSTPRWGFQHSVASSNHGENSERTCAVPCLKTCQDQVVTMLDVTEPLASRKNAANDESTSRLVHRLMLKLNFERCRTIWLRFREIISQRTQIVSSGSRASRHPNLKRRKTLRWVRRVGFVDCN